MTFTLSALDEDGLQSRQATMGHRVYVTLRHAIVQLQLRPGNLLSEAEVAKQLGISRQPVREAFIKLAEAGLVEIRPQRGTFVVLISRRDVVNAQFIREAIEVATARKACLEATPAEVRQLRELIIQQREASEAIDHEAFLRLDESFHYQIAKSAECEHAWQVIESFKAQMDRVRFLSVQLATPYDLLIAQHESIVDGIAAKSPDQAETAIQKHLSEILNSLPKIASANPDLFRD